MTYLIELELTYCHTRPVIFEQYEHQKVQRQYPKEYEQYDQRAKMEEQERMEYLRQPTLQPIIESPERHLVVAVNNQ